MKFIRAILIMALLLNLPLAHGATSKSISFTAEIWADNWFALYVNGKKVGEDSVPITTQKSFNSEVIKFNANYPFTMGVIAKDYVQSKSGLEYIGTPNQQIGDGGLIFQVRETVSRKLVTVSNDSWKAKVSNTAPTNPQCEKSNQPDIDCKYQNVIIPSSWANSTYNDRSWQAAKIFSASEVGPKEGFYDINWDQSAKFIWGNNLKLDNVIYFRKKIVIPTFAVVSNAITNFDFTITSSTNGTLNLETTCDGVAKSPGISWVGVPPNAKSLVLIMDTIPGPPRPGESQVGNHYYITQTNISPSITSIPEGGITPYSPPCSQGPGIKEYRFFLYALDRLLPINQNMNGTSLSALANSESIAKAFHVYTYARQP